MKRTTVLLGFLLALVGVPMQPASASVITFNLDFEFSGATPPAGPTPWVTGRFEDLAGGGVQLTISAVNLTGSEFIRSFYFNLNPTLNAATFFPFPPNTGTQTAWESISAGNNLFKADGDGYFDYVVNFPTSGAGSNRFTAGETFILTWGATLGLTVNEFNFASVNGPVGKTGFFAAAHIQSIGASGDDSGWIGAGGGRVPEPSSLFLIGLGLAGLAVWGRRKTA